MEVNILVPFIIVAGIAFVVIIMCVLLMVDIKIRAIAQNITLLVKLVEKLVDSESINKNDSSQQ